MEGRRGRVDPARDIASMRWHQVMREPEQNSLPGTRAASSMAGARRCGLPEHHHNPLAASATARNNARPLLIVSSHSLAGSES